MKQPSPLSKLQNRLEELKKEEEQLSRSMKTLADNIQKNATPMGIAKGVASKMFKDKSGLATTATAALGLGASLVAGNIARKQQRLSLIGKVVGLASGLLMARLAKRKQSKDQES